MPDAIRTASYFKLAVPNRAGEAARRLAALREAGVNLLAFSGFPRGRRSQLDFVPADAAAFKAVARRGKWKVEGPKTCLLLDGEERVGALAQVLEKLAAAGINVTAVDAASAGAGRWGAILWVDPRAVKKAAKALGAA